MSQDLPHRQRAAVLVEFTAALVLWLVIVGFAFDMTLNAFYRSMFSHAAATASRRYVVEIGANLACSTLTSTLQQAVQNELSELLGIPAQAITLQSSFEKSASHVCSVKVVGTWDLPCSICIWRWGTFRVRTETRTVIEDRCFDCTCT